MPTPNFAGNEPVFGDIGPIVRRIPQFHSFLAMVNSSLRWWRWARGACDHALSLHAV